MTKPYDLIVIGTGTAAMTAPMRVRAAGWRVAVIDYRPFGGTCALRGCDPKKMLIGGAEALDHARRMQGQGITGDVHVDWQPLMAFKRTFTDPVPEKMAERYRDKDIDAFHGKARFLSEKTLQLAEASVLEGKHFLIASGAEPVKLDIPGEEHLIDNEGFLTLKTLPKRIRPGGRRIHRCGVLACRGARRRPGHDPAARATHAHGLRPRPGRLVDGLVCSAGHRRADQDQRCSHRENDGGLSGPFDAGGNGVDGRG